MTAHGNQSSFGVEGLGGKRILKGELPVHGAKNAALQAFAFSLLFEDALQIERVPNIEDINSMKAILSALGSHIEHHPSTRGYKIQSASAPHSILPHDLSRNLRASIIVTGPVLARTGRVQFSHPGGCVIGSRPIDVFLEGFKSMGAKLETLNETYTLSTEGAKLRGAEIFMRIPSVTATQTFMMAAVLADGVTHIKNAALEPETESLAEYLNACGARIIGAGTPNITVWGGTLLRASGLAYRVPPDRIEAGSFLILAALAAEDVLISQCEPRHLEALLAALCVAGVNAEVGRDYLRVTASSNQTAYRSVEIKTHEYPGFPTDLQAPMVVFLTQCKGTALVFETIFEGRLNYVESLTRMGADIKSWDNHRVSVSGPTPLAGKELQSPDIRAGLAFLVAAIVANGHSTIHNAYYIDRGYEKIEQRLHAVGVNIERVMI